MWRGGACIISYYPRRFFLRKRKARVISLRTARSQAFITTATGTTARPCAATTTTTNLSMSTSSTTTTTTTTQCRLLHDGFHSSSEEQHEPTTTFSSTSWRQQQQQERPAATLCKRTFHFDTYTAALEFAQKVNEMSGIMDHFPAHMKFTRQIEKNGGFSSRADHGGGGIQLEMTWCSTYDETQTQTQTTHSRTTLVTKKDYLAARAVDLISSSNNNNNNNNKNDERTTSSEINLARDYTYTLHEASIATFPALPRGSSKLLTLDAHGRVEYHHHFENAIVQQLTSSSSSSFDSGSGCSNSNNKNFLLVLNDSRVLDARLYIIHSQNHDNGNNDENIKNDKDDKIELMLLDLGDINVDTATCRDTPLRAMIRLETGLKAGDLFTIVQEKLKQPPPPKKKKDSMNDDDDDDDDANDDKVVQVKVVDIVGTWHEDETSDGNGMECIVCIDSDLTIQQLLQRAGSVPIPPYFHRAAVASDTESYNTVYAQHGGSVAAPTAGLHFTNNVLSQIGRDNICYLSLHVGAGTFQPVVEMHDARRHVMHAETFAVPVSEIKRIIAALQGEDGSGGTNNKEIVAVGTTSTRTLESLYWCGIKCIIAAAKAAKKEKAAMAAPAAAVTPTESSIDDNSVTVREDLVLGQFEWIPLNVVAATAGEKNQSTNEPTRITRIAALQALLDDHFQKGDNHEEDTAVIRGRTSLMITPESYEFQMVDRLVTNFHAPDSTLMLLVSAFIQSNGRNQKIRKIYEQAQEHGFRFLSYGDSCLFSKPLQES